MYRIKRAIDSLDGTGPCPDHPKNERMVFYRTDGTPIHVPACSGRSVICKNALSSKFLQMLENREQIIQDQTAIIRSKDEIIEALKQQIADARQEKKSKSDEPSVTYHYHGDVTINTTIVAALPEISSQFLLDYARHGLKMNVNPLPAIREAILKAPPSEDRDAFEKLAKENPKEFEREIFEQMKEAAEESNDPDKTLIIAAVSKKISDMNEVD